MADKASLVDQVKQIQRSDPEAKQQWWEYCDQKLGGVKDPNRHDAGVLEEFLNSIGVAPEEASSRPPAKKRHSDGGKGGDHGHSKRGNDWGQSGGQSYQGGYDGWGGYGGNYYGGQQQQQQQQQQQHQPWVQNAGGDSSVADMIKTGQRRSHQWKAAWQAYCQKCGNGFGDPARYDEQFLLDFIDYAGQLVVQDMGPAQPSHPPPPAVHHALEPPIGAGKRPVGSGAPLPPAKRAAIGGVPEQRRGGGGYKPPNDADKGELVSRVKELQRTNPDAKVAWQTFCEEFQQGIKDPNRHDPSVLLEFLQGWD